MEELKLKTICHNLLEKSDEERQEIYEEAGRIIRAGGTVVFPTETVYGLGADAMNPSAVRAIYTAKGRPSDNPLIVHVAGRELTDLVAEIPPLAETLIEKYWPGPLTIIMKKNPKLPDATTGSLSTVGVRMPDQAAALGFIKASGRFIAAPSANISGRPSPTTYERCVEDLDGRVDMILGMDQSRVGLESTIIDVSGDIPELLRPGAVTLEMLEETIGPVRYVPGGLLAPDEAPRAPGMKYRHYAPKAKVTIFSGAKDLVEAEMLRRKTSDNMLIFTQASASENPPELETLPGKDIEGTGPVVRFRSVREASHGIFEILRRADDLGCREILIQAVPEKGLGLSLMNRVKKAAAYDIVEVK